MFGISGKATILVFSSAFIMGISARAQSRLTSQSNPPVTFLDSTRKQDGLFGSVRRVRTQAAKLEMKKGSLTEGPLQLLEITAYNPAGKRVDNVYYPVTTSDVGKEEYKYDDSGNIVEMTLRNDEGSLLSKQKYEYEFDEFGNWTKMVASLVLFEDGDLKTEPVEVTYRALTYYFDDSVEKVISNSAKPDAAKQLTNPDSRFSPLAVSSAPESILGDRVAAQVNTASVTTLIPEAIEYYRLGHQRAEAGDLRGAIEAFRKASELAPESAEVQLSLGRVYIKLKKDGEAIKALKRSISLDARPAEAHYDLGLAYFQTSRFKDAETAFKKATLLSPDMAKAHYGLALAYQELGNQDALIEEYRKLQSLNESLAKQLSERFPEFDLPCKVPPYCK